MRFTKKNISLILLFLFIASFYAINNYIWLTKSQYTTYDDDESFHLKDLIDDFLKRNCFKQPFHTIRYATRDPIYYYAASFSNIIFGRSLKAIRMFNIFWFIIMLFAVYLLAKDLFSHKTAVFSLVILSLIPSIYGNSRLFRTEFALAALFPFFVLNLLKTDYFKKRYYSLLLGFTFGFLMLTKELSLIYLFPITAIYFFHSYKKNRTKIIFNFLLFLAISIIISFPRYWSADILKMIFVQTPFGEIHPLLEQINRYTIGLMYDHLSPLFFLLFLFGLFYIFKEKKYPIKYIFITWIFIPIIILTLIPHRNAPRYIIPIMPPIAILIAAAINSISFKKLKIILLFIVITLGLVQYYDFSFYPIANLKKLNFKINDSRIPYFYGSRNGACYPEKYNIFFKIINIIKTYSNNEQNNKIKVIVFPTKTILMHRWYIHNYFSNENIEFSVTYIDHNCLPSLMKKLPDTDYVIYFFHTDDFKLYWKSQFRSFFIKGDKKNKEYFDIILKQINTFSIIKKIKKPIHNYYYFILKKNK